ncbi:MAG: hypothetical protein ACR9NN_03845 [Nostochopsis sp.]
MGFILCGDRSITTQWSGQYQDPGVLPRLPAAAHFSRYAPCAVGYGDV